MRRARLALLLPAALLIAFAWLQLGLARDGLVVRPFTRDGIPMLYVAPAGAVAAPGVLIAHGFSGSKQLMLAYSYTLAHAGYATLAWDFDGHGSNPRRLTRDALQDNIDAAAGALTEQPEVDPDRLALLGHSMGSGAVMSAGIREPDFAAVVAISPTGAAVTPASPRNLLLQAGSLEGGFVANAEKLLAAAGGESDNLGDGKGRALVVVPFAEHITILYRAQSHRAALDWLGRTFGTARTTPYVDRRIVWYGLHLLGWLLALLAVAPALAVPGVPQGRPTARRRWLGMLGAAAIGVALVGLAGRLLPLSGFLGIQVGGFVALWLCVAGLVWLGFNRPLALPAPAGIALGLLLFVFLVVAFGVMAQDVWLQWWLNLPRFWRWPLLAALCLPWFLAGAFAQWGDGPARRLLWWLGQSVVVMAAMIVLLILVPGVSFLMLIIPTFPLILAVLSVTASAFNRPWPLALGSALFFGWLLAAVFPLA